MSKTTAPYGSWTSPITSQLTTERAVQLSGVEVDKGSRPLAKCSAFWTEVNFEQGGRYSVHCWGPTCSKEWTAETLNARTLVHEYGGSNFTVHNGRVFFSNFEDQRLYEQDGWESPAKPITPNGKRYQYANGFYSETHQLLYLVREDHGVVQSGQAKEAKTNIVAVNPSKMEDETVVVDGADFYSSPQVSPDGRHLVYFQWAHPNMPWDETELVVVPLSADGRSVVNDQRKSIGDGKHATIEPRFSPSGRSLYFISDDDEWWNLYRYDMATGSVEKLFNEKSELGSPHWQFGYHRYDVFEKDGVDHFVTSYGPAANAGILQLSNVNDRVLKPILDNSVYSSCSFVRYNSQDGMVYCRAGGPRTVGSILQVDPTTGNVRVIRKSKELTIDTGYLSVPEEISWPTTDGHVSHGYFYPPTNKDFQAPDGERPPLLVKIHGGPTAATNSDLNLKIQYWTSKGFAVLDVNYRGSTGYGRTYRHLLYGKWGIYDVDDCCSGAEYLAKEGRVDGKRLCIDGGSAGGYTTLGCLAFRDVFSAGASHYGVADCGILAAETHKFESRYLDKCIGVPYTPETKHIYDERSPLYSAEKISRPVAFFQGDDDRIVPPNQSEMFHELLKKRGIPTALKMFAGEQHGFRKAENIQCALDGEYMFYCKVFGMPMADNVPAPDLVIDNLKS